MDGFSLGCSVSFSDMVNLLLKVCTNALLNGFQLHKNDVLSRRRRSLGDETGDGKIGN